MRHFVFFLLLTFLFLASCGPSLSDKQIFAYTEKGDSISNHAKKELSTALMAKMKKGGLPEAIDFCSKEALPLTKKIADQHGVLIKRASHRSRNSLNIPEENELYVIKEYQNEINSGATLKPRVRLDPNGIPHYYTPILVENKCLMCHGTLNKELSKSADSIIKSYYPEDLATGFAEGDLRGIWSISFEKYSKSSLQ